MRYRKHRSIAIAAGSLAILLAGCSGSDEPSVSATPQGAVFPPPTTAAPASTPTPTPVPTPTPTPLPLPPDPTVIPDSPADIDIEYMQAVVDVFAHNEGEIVREAVTNGEFTERMIKLMDEAYGEDLRDDNVLGWQEEFVNDPELSNFSENPGDPLWTVQEVMPTEPGCVAVRVLTDRNPTASGGKLRDEEIFVLLKPRSSRSEFSPWIIADTLYFAPDQDPGNPCA